MSGRGNTNMHLKNAYLELPSSFPIRWWFLQVPAPHQHWSTLIISLFAQPKTLLELITPRIGTKIAFHVCTVPMEVQITGTLWKYRSTYISFLLHYRVLSILCRNAEPQWHISQSTDPACGANIWQSVCQHYAVGLRWKQSLTLAFPESQKSVALCDLTYKLISRGPFSAIT